MQTKGNAAGLKLIKLNEGRHSQTLRSHCLNDMILMLHNDPNEWHCGKWRVQCVWSLTPYNQLWITLSYIEFNGSFFNFSLERPHLHELNTKSMEFSFKQQTLTMASIVKRQIAQKHINQYRVQVMLLSWLRFSHKTGYMCVSVCSPLPWQKSSIRMVCRSASVVRVRSNSGPTFGSRAPFTHWSWDDVTRFIRASEIYPHTQRQIKVCRYTRVEEDKTHLYTVKDNNNGKRHVQSNKRRKWEHLHPISPFKYACKSVIRSLHTEQPPCPGTGSISPASLHCVWQVKWGRH